MLTQINTTFARDNSGLVSVLLTDAAGNPVGYIEERILDYFMVQATDPEGNVTFEARTGPLGLQQAIGWGIQWAAGLFEGVPA